MMKKQRKIRVVSADLTNENNYAQVDIDRNLIELHHDLKGRTRLRKLIHELVHISFPQANESQVKRAEKIIGNELWKYGYRHVDLRKK